MRSLTMTLILVSSLLTSTARAYTPENGTWWNPAEPGTGLLIELQDDFMAVFLYVYDQAGNRTWYTATNFMSGNARFEANLDAFQGGTCVGCAYRPTAYTGAAGTMSIDFDPSNPMQGVLTWKLNSGPQRSLPIERYPFYLKRGEDGSAPLEITKMLGEWQGVLDFSAHPSASLNYYGEVLVVDRYEYDNQEQRWFFDGCRPGNAVIGLCTAAALQNHAVSGSYINSSGRQLIVTVDTTDGAGNPLNCVLYDVQTGTDYFSGGLNNSREGEQGGVTVYPCGNDPFDYDFYPVRGFRSASRSYAQGDDNAPSKSAAIAEATPVAEKTGTLPAPRQSSTKTAIDPRGMTEQVALVRTLEARLSAKRTAAGRK